MADERRAERLAIVVQDLHEVFRIYSERPPGLKERLYRFRRSDYTEFHALKGVSLTIRHGESVGLIGHNGSGKSTLLKCLAQILPADAGSVEVNGRVATLLELGAGFHPDLSGRENISLNGAILGLTKREIAASYDRIVEFAGIRDFIDTPVRNYSSGMYVRLGFAIAVHVDPEILLVDEVLSVGDATFQERSLERMRSFSRRGKTVVLVTHDLTSIAALCERTIVLDHGRIAFDGPTEEALEAYSELIADGAGPSMEIEEETEDAPPEPEPEPLRNGDNRARVARIALDPDRTQVAPGQALDLVIEVEARDDLVADGGLTCGIAVRREDLGPYVYETRTSWRGIYLAPPPLGERATVTFGMSAHLLTGEYVVDAFVGNAERPGVVHDRWREALRFTVTAPDHDYGIAALDADVRIHNPEGIWPPESEPPPVADGGPAHHPRHDPSPS